MWRLRIEARASSSEGGSTLFDRVGKQLCSVASSKMQHSSHQTREIISILLAVLASVPRLGFRNGATSSSDSESLFSMKIPDATRNNMSKQRAAPTNFVRFDVLLIIPPSFEDFEDGVLLRFETDFFSIQDRSRLGRCVARSPFEHFKAEY
jgi:hypothetical protein